MKKLFVSDLDGTLLKIGNEYSAGVSEQNQKAILDYVKAGNIFAIASARGLRFLDEFESVLGFRPDFIGLNGAALSVGGQITTEYISWQLFEEVTVFAEEQMLKASITFLTNQDKSYILNKKYYPYGVENALHDARFMDRLHQDFPKDEKNVTIMSMALFVEPERLDAVRNILKNHFAGRLEIAASDSDLISITPFGSTKGNGVVKLMEYYGINQENVAVIGDSDNDVSMFQAVTHSYCMDHSEADVKAQAETVVASVAEALEHFLRFDS